MELSCWGKCWSEPVTQYTLTHHGCGHCGTGALSREEWCKFGKPVAPGGQLRRQQCRGCVSPLCVARAVKSRCRSGCRDGLRLLRVSSRQAPLVLRVHESCRVAPHLLHSVPTPNIHSPRPVVPQLRLQKRAQCHDWEDGTTTATLRSVCPVRAEKPRVAFS